MNGQMISELTVLADGGAADSGRGQNGKCVENCNWIFVTYEINK